MKWEELRGISLPEYGQERLVRIDVTPLGQVHAIWHLERVASRSLFVQPARRLGVLLTPSFLEQVSEVMLPFLRNLANHADVGVQPVVVCFGVGKPDPLTER